MELLRRKKRGNDRKTSLESNIFLSRHFRANFCHIIYLSYKNGQGVDSGEGGQEKIKKPY